MPLFLLASHDNIRIEFRVFTLPHQREKGVGDGEELHRSHRSLGFERERQREEVGDDVSEKGLVDGPRPDGGEGGEEEVPGAETDSTRSPALGHGGDVVGLFETEALEFIAVVVERSEEGVEHRQTDLVAYGGVVRRHDRKLRGA